MNMVYELRLPTRWVMVVIYNDEILLVAQCQARIMP